MCGRISASIFASRWSYLIECIAINFSSLDEL